MELRDSNMKNSELIADKQRKGLKCPLPAGTSVQQNVGCAHLRTDKNRIDKQKCAAFSLAEVLITLGIIGIVAAMTLPTLITNYREKQRVTQLKKTYSTLQQALLRAEETHGEYQYWDLAATDTGEFDENGQKILDHSGEEKVLAYLGESLNAPKSESELQITYYMLHGALLERDDVFAPNQYLKLNDGSILITGWVNKDKNVMDMLIYYSGCEKKGCRIGRDMFYFSLSPKKGFAPKGLPGESSTMTFESNCNLSKNGKYNGRPCTAWVIYKGNMDYLHCNNLSWNGKSKCSK